MKHLRKLIPILAVLLLGGISQSCDNDDDLIWDASPVIAKIDITDNAGVSLLDCDAEKNIVGEQITMEYEGQTYEVDWEKGKDIYSRAYLAIFDGITYQKSYYKDNDKTNKIESHWILSIGEFPGDESYKKTFILNFRGKKYEISLENKAKGHNHTTTYYFNGKKQDHSLITIVAE